MRHVPLERDINIAVNGCSWFTTSTQKGPFTAMLISRTRGTCLIHADAVNFASAQPVSQRRKQRWQHLQPQHTEQHPLD